MGLFDFISQMRSNARIRSLEAAVQEHPSPALCLQLADAHREAGNGQRAAQVLKTAVAKFPKAPEIVRRQAEMEKAEREAEKKRLVASIQTHPNPRHYARLAELYNADGDRATALDICQRGIKVSPKYGGNYLVLGQIYVEQKEWPNAAAALERAVGLDRYNYLALKLLAQVYTELGRHAEAATQLEEILSFLPGQEEILTLVKKARAAAGLGAFVEPKPADRTKQHTAFIERRSAELQAIAKGQTNIMIKGKPLATLPKAAELLAADKSGAEKTSPPSPPGHAPTMPAASRDAGLTAGLAKLRGVGGVIGALVVDEYGLVIAADLDAALEEGVAAALIANVFRIAGPNAPRLGLGQFQEALIEGETAHVHLAHVENLLLTVFAKPEVKTGLLEKNIHDVALTLIQQAGK